MRSWSYTYKSSDGLRHEDMMSAPTKDAVYSELRRRGIRPIHVTERIAPVVRIGFRGLRKREWCIISCLGALALILAALFAFHAAEATNTPRGTDAQGTGRLPTVRQGAHPSYVTLVGKVEQMVDAFQRRVEAIDWELLANYALLAEKQNDISLFRAEIDKAHLMFNESRDNAKKEFFVLYETIPSSCESDRTDAQRIYGILMGEFDKADERLYCDECAIEILAENLGKWRVIKGQVIWDDDMLRQTFLLYSRENLEGTSRWRKDFGDPSINGVEF